MKHGKKYNESAKLIDRAKVYDSMEALGLTISTAKANLTKRLSCMSVWVLTPVMLTSRFAALSFFRTAQVNPFVSLRCAKATMLRLQRRLALIMQETMSLFKRFRAKAGWILTLSSQRRI